MSQRNFVLIIHDFCTVASLPSLSDVPSLIPGWQLQAVVLMSLFKSYNWLQKHKITKIYKKDSVTKKRCFKSEKVWVTESLEKKPNRIEHKFADFIFDIKLFKNQYHRLYFLKVIFCWIYNLFDVLWKNIDVSSITIAFQNSGSVRCIA